MDRRMERIAVSTTQTDSIEISQELPPLETSRILIEPDQVDAVVAWLNEARDEIRGEDEGREGTAVREGERDV